MVDVHPLEDIDCIRMFRHIVIDQGMQACFTAIDNSNGNLKYKFEFWYFLKRIILLSVFSQRNWNSQRLFPFVICLILIVSSSSRYWEQEMIVTIFMSTMESLSAILHVKYRFNVFSIYGRYTHNYSV